MRKSVSKTQQDTPALEKPVRFLRRGAVQELTGLKTSTLYAMISEGQFPKPIKIGKRLVAWPEDQVAAWQASRIAKSAMVQG